MNSLIINEIDRQELSVDELTGLLQELESLKYDLAFFVLKQSTDKEKLLSYIERNEKIIGIIKNMYVRQSALNKMLTESRDASLIKIAEK